MGWLDDQIQQRKAQDDETFARSFDAIAKAIIGRSVENNLNAAQITKSSLEEVLKYYHIKIKDIEIPESIEDSAGQFEYLLECYGLMVREVKLEPGWYKDAYGPMIVPYKDSNKTVALLPNKLLGYSYVDVQSVKRRINKDTVKLFENRAFCFYRPFESKKLGIKDLYMYMFSTYTVSDIVFLLGVMAAVTGIGMINPMLTKLLYSTVEESGSIRLLIAMLIFMMSVSLSSIMIRAASTLINQKVTMKQSMCVEAAIMMRILALPSSFFKKFSSGELSQRIQYVNTLCSTLMNTITNTGISSLFSLLYIVQVFQYAPALLIPSLVVTITSILFSVISTLVQMKITKQKMDVNAKEYGLSYAILSGIQKIKLAGAEKRAFSNWAQIYAKELQLTYNPPVFIKLNSLIASSISLIGTIVIYYFAIQSKVTVSDYMAFNASFGMVSAALNQLSSIALTVAQIKPIIDMAQPILDAVPENGEEKVMVNHLRGGIEMSNVSFRYSKDMPLVLKNLNLKIKPGEYLAICGMTGCGKSTLMRLLLGFEVPEKGAIYYDKKDLSGLNLKSVRKQIGCVMQNGELFEGDIYSNIVISHPQLTVQDAWNAARIAHIDKDIEVMPMGMGTLISEGAGGISGGQKQRLLIARAVAGKPSILMFDEATSALDNITQRQVSQSLDELHCTRIVIAHRLSTIRHCDRIIVLDKGNIVEDGTYEQLIAQKGLFAELVERQKVEA